MESAKPGPKERLRQWNRLIRRNAKRLEKKKWQNLAPANLSAAAFGRVFSGRAPLADPQALGRDLDAALGHLEQAGLAGGEGASQESKSLALSEALDAIAEAAGRAAELSGSGALPFGRKRGLQESMPAAWSRLCELVELWEALAAGTAGMHWQKERFGEFKKVFCHALCEAVAKEGRIGQLWSAGFAARKSRWSQACAWKTPGLWADALAACASNRYCAQAYLSDLRDSGGDKRIREAGDPEGKLAQGALALARLAIWEPGRLPQAAEALEAWLDTGKRLGVWPARPAARRSRGELTQQSLAKALSDEFADALALGQARADPGELMQAAGRLALLCAGKGLDFLPEEQAALRDLAEGIGEAEYGDRSRFELEVGKALWAAREQKELGELARAEAAPGRDLPSGSRL